MCKHSFNKIIRTYPVIAKGNASFMVCDGILMSGNHILMRDEDIPVSGNDIPKPGNHFRVSGDDRLGVTGSSGPGKKDVLMMNNHFRKQSNS